MIVIYYVYTRGDVQSSITFGPSKIPEHYCESATLANECVWIVPGTLTPEDAP